jgi:hypothetical protein
MGFTAGTGEPVMCAIILNLNKEMKYIPLNWTWGIDIRKNLISGENEVEVFERNCGDVQVMAGGPKCCFNGKDVPCFV